MTPLPGGFPKDKAIDNAASVRVSRPGLDFVEQNLPAVVSKVADAPGGILGIDIPNTDPPPAEITGGIEIDPNICPGGPNPGASPPKCRAEIGIGGSTFQIDSIKPNALTIRASVPLKLEDTPVDAKLKLFFNLGTLTIHVGYGDGGCSGGKPQVTPHALPLVITVPLVEETTTPRNGYMKIDVNNAIINMDGLNENDVKACMNCGFAANVCSAVTNSNFVKNLILDQLRGNLDGQVKKLLSDALCTAPNPGLNPPCPTNTSPDGSNKKCVFDADKSKCVSTLLGLDGHVNLGGLLKSISPGTAGAIDFGLAASGSMKPFPNADANGQGRTPNGITLGMLGGVVSQPLSKCVPQATLTVPTGIPLPDELTPTTNDPAGTPHMSLALAGRFLDYTMGSLYNSGFFCLGVSSEQFEVLRTGLLSVIIPSLKMLTFEESDGAAAISMRPQAPPTVKIGGGTNVDSDPILAITLPKLAMDFYVWRLDRFVRVFTFESDVTIPVNLQTGKDPEKNPKGGIIPAIGDLKVENGTIQNSDLLLDDPTMVASSLSGLLTGVGKQLVGGGFSPIDLSSALKSFDLGLEIGQIKKLTKGTDEYVGIFANLTKVTSTATAEADVRARLVGKSVPKDRMQLATMENGVLPELDVEVSSPLDDGRHAVEYSWWIDTGTRSPWGPALPVGEAGSTRRHIVIKDGQLLLQGRHLLKVSARLVGQAETEDLTPAEVPFTIDALAPSVRLAGGSEGVRVEARDLVSAPAALLARYRLDEGAFTDWRPLAEVSTIAPGAAEAVDVEVKDEEGNVRSVRQELVRGRADSTLAASGCGCSTPGSRDTNGGLAAIALALGGVAFIAVRRRRQSVAEGASPSPRLGAAALALASIGLVAATSQGCSCGSEDDNGSSSQNGCGSDCNQECKPALALGRPGSYTSLAKGPDGAIWVAGYNEALLSEGDNQLYGDLVVGKYDAPQDRVDWKTVDGLPARPEGTCPDRARDTWRNGESDSGDNVGLWTSIRVSGSGTPMVSYYDSTHKSLKFAFEREGWKNFTLREQPSSDIGRYSKMLIVDGKPLIAFLQIEAGAEGHTRSKVVVARANVEVPQSASDFRFEDAAVEENNPCVPSTCGVGEVCMKATGLCTLTVTGCTDNCGDTKACVTEGEQAKCLAIRSDLRTSPDVFGDFISISQGGGNQLGMVVYDRPHGNLVALKQVAEGKWERTILDGETGSRGDKTALDTGDVGISASLVIDGLGVWHISYVSGLDETLRYISIIDGKVGRPEIIDDGSMVDDQPFADGKHIVGDDSAIQAESDTVTLYYQDATAGKLRRAVGTREGDTHKWALRVVPQPNRFAGYSPQIVPGENKVANFWETWDRGTRSAIGDVAIVSPP